jgi:hypothetical protein
MLDHMALRALALPQDGIQLVVDIAGNFKHLFPAQPPASNETIICAALTDPVDVIAHGLCESDFTNQITQLGDADSPLEHLDNSTIVALTRQERVHQVSTTQFGMVLVDPGIGGDVLTLASAIMLVAVLAGQIGPEKYSRLLGRDFDLASWLFVGHKDIHTVFNCAPDHVTVVLCYGFIALATIHPVTISRHWHSYLLSLLSRVAGHDEVYHNSQICQGVYQNF